MSLLPALTRLFVAVPGSKSAVPLKVPAVSTFPLPSTAMALPASSPVPPSRRVQISAPAAEYLATNASVPPALVRL